MVRQRKIGGWTAFLGLFVLLFASVVQGQQNGALSITHQGFSRPQARGKPLAIEATITAAAGVRKAQVFCRSAGSGDFMALPMSRIEGERYRAMVPDWLLAGSGLEYYIEATDGNGQAASQGFRGFPLQVLLVSTRRSSQEERLKALQDALDLIRQQNQSPGAVDRHNSNR